MATPSKESQIASPKGNTTSGFRTHLATFFQGVAIGAANAIPGVSGGTLALVFGIYESLIDSLKAFGRKPFWQAVVKFDIPAAYKQVNGNFLVVLILGAIIALLSLAQVLGWSFANYPVFILSFFFGLILASVLPVSRFIEKWNAVIIGSFVFGAVFGFVLVGLTPTNLPNTPLILFFSGALAAATMIIPGVSGSFVLVLLGNYEYVLSIVNTRDWFAIFIFGLGAILGILSLAQLLSWLFKTYRNLTLAVLAGFMLGSLRKIWPWKLGGFEDTQVPENILPQITINGTLNIPVIISIALIGVGIGLVLIIDKLSQKSAS